MVEADAGKFGKGDGEDGEIDAGDAKAEGKEADDRPAAAATGIAASRPSQGPMPN